MIFHVVRRRHLWCVDGAEHTIGGVFVDLESALRFIREYGGDARVLVSESSAAA